ncbi:MAG: putative LPLAT superfamily acyltransferase [Phenylobacterium sp.]|jgi:predicted LPLAT superfamily acyltransferase
MTEPQSPNQQQQKHWSLMAERGSYWGIWFLLKTNQLFGRWLFRLVIWPVVAYFFVSGKTARRASMDYLNRVHQFSGGSVLAEKPGYWQSLKHFISFAESAMDKIDGWSGKHQKQDLSFGNRHLFTDLNAKKQGAVFIGAHLGNLELCRALNKDNNNRVNVMVFTHHAEAFNRILKRIDPDMDLNLIQVTEVSADLAIILKQRIDDGEHIVIAADRTSTSSFGRVTQVSFLGKPASISQGPFILAALMDCPVYMMFCMKESQGFKVIFDEFEHPFKGPRKQRQQMLLQNIGCYVKQLEHYCLKYPYQWFNFFDFWLDDEQVKRSQAKPGETKPGETKPGETKPGETKPNESQAKP